MKTPTELTGDTIRANIREQFEQLVKDCPAYETILRETSDEQFRKYVLLQIAVLHRDIRRLSNRVWI